MRLNSLSPAEGARHAPKRVGRGIGSGLGKTGGRGHKGLKSRSGGSVKPGFEGGQQPLARRLPKFGFSSRRQAAYQEVRLGDLHKVEGDTIDLVSLRKAKLIGADVRVVKVIKHGELRGAVTIKGLRVTKGAKELIENAGGKIEG